MNKVTLTALPIVASLTMLYAIGNNVGFPAQAATQAERLEEARKRDTIGVILSQMRGAVPAGNPVRYVDADTFDLPIHPYDGWTIPVRIRLINANAPETRSPKCAREKALAGEATAMVKKLLSDPGAKIELSVLGGFDEYDRYLAAVTVNGNDLGETLVDAGLARVWTEEYQGQTKQYWCS